MSFRRPAAGGERATFRAAIAAVMDVAGIVREMLAWPLRVWLWVAQPLGSIVLGAWRSVALRVGAWALRIAQRELTTARALALVALAATIALGASQFADYRAVEVGPPEYESVKSVAPAPQVDSSTPRSAHGIAVFAIAVASLFVIAFAAGGNWRLARALVPLGAAAVLISLLADVHQGLSEGNSGIAYEGANAVLLGGFWAQLFSAATLIAVGPLLASELRGGRQPRRARRVVRRSRRRRTTARLGRRAGSSGVEGAAP